MAVIKMWIGDQKNKENKKKFGVNWKLDIKCQLKRNIEWNINNNNLKFKANIYLYLNFVKKIKNWIYKSVFIREEKKRIKCTNRNNKSK